MWFASLLQNEWWNFLESILTIATLTVAIFTFRFNNRVRQASSLMEITTAHRRIWREFAKNPKLHRVRDSKADLDAKPMTVAERRFAQEVIFLSLTTFHTMRLSALFELKGLKRDLGRFLRFPIPNSVYESDKHLYDKQFVDYAESAIAHHASLEKKSS